ncbi:heme exporter protein CcmD [Thermomonas hydrothermalis]|uniref:Heme exporter protein D n=1 Tax=Thermomonas hydrothermalis TaxID=213588 RepID=A0A1M4SV92_9GAMM|nr:heme exporter protein CcmD [Thermomonas hydrothermalis]MCL6619744.1 heme exporter protein CcmD [Thermomonas hydrothermalis]SHE36104.1 Heme exporter protein D (CcmD) [Thermomonas hydrothermalis]
MSYREYVIAAYAVFALFLLWDALTPALQVRAIRRLAQRQARRRTAARPAPDLPLSRD